MISRRAGALLGCLLIAGVLATPAIPSSGAGASPAATSAAGFLAREFARLGHSYPSPITGNPDGGVIADALIGMHAAGMTGGEFTAATAALRKSFFNGALTASGFVAKYLMVATRAGVDPASWGTDSQGKPIDLVRRLESTMDENGRYRDLNAGSYDPRRDASNVFSQSLAMIALHELGRTGDHAKALGYLLRQQCPGGGFRALPPPADPVAACADEKTVVDADYTAMGAWALAETRSDPAALAKAVGWLRAHQLADGSFKNRDGAPSANSTGLAALAFTKAGDVADAGRANGWLVSMQLPAGGAVPAMAGAVAASADAYLTIQRDPAGYWAGAGQQDQLRRATAQAVLGLSAAPVGEVPPPPVAPADPAVPASRAGKPPAPSASPVAPAVSAAGPGVGPAAGSSGGTPEVGPPTVAPAVPPLASPVAVAEPEPVAGIGGAAALPPREADFLDFLRSPWGIAASVLAGFAMAVAGYWLVTRKSRTSKG
ncbi:prenyltransferase/squalene oxidase repeat-containing protein [Amycolatopsis samaneae]|uniref:prenyltransferase/squalene oxidase repeat-containing protein n=1 Tax=Amycolatopsis samaneae TaxID=664691 RepID=UPI0036150370